jgi:hypothetical protein
MTMTKIPDIAFEVDGDYINLEQDSGCGEVDYVQLHKLHLRYLAEQSGILQEQRESELSARTSELMKIELLDLRDGIEWLHDYLDAVPSFPPQARVPEEVERAWQLLGQVERILHLCGIKASQPGKADSPCAETATETIADSATVAKPATVDRSQTGNGEELPLFAP